MDAIPSIDAQVSMRLSKSFFTGVNEKKENLQNQSKFTKPISMVNGI